MIVRLTSLRAGDDRSLDGALDAVIRELDAARAGAKGVRGVLRDRLLERLRTLERELLDAARGCLAPAVMAEIEREADAELAPFRARMPADAYQRSRAACIDRIVRDRARLPVLAFE